MAKKSKLISPDRVYNEEDPKMEELVSIPKEDKNDLVLEEQEIRLEMHKSLYIDGTFRIENLGGGDVHINDEVLYFGGIVEVTGTTVLYATCYPKVKLTRLGV